MSIATGLRTHLINNAAVAALVSDRVYPSKLPQGYRLPAISCQKISGAREYYTEGPTGRVNFRFQVDCLAESAMGVSTLADKVRLALNGHKGALGDESDVGSIELTSDRDGFNEITEEFKVILEFKIPFLETI